MTIYTNAALLGAGGLAWSDIVVRDGLIAAIVPAGDASRSAQGDGHREGQGDGPGDDREDLAGQIVSVPMCDLQVNGGGGLMLGDCATVADLRRLARAHLRDGVPLILPTLISDNAAQIERIASLIARARAQGMEEIAGLHLEGPHITRAGAHDPAKLRPLTGADLARYARIAAEIGCLKITLAPELVAAADIAALVQAGIVVALGHSDCDAATARSAFAAGAVSATHLWNAMSGLDHRTPGLALAALEQGRFGLIADGVHVAPGMLRLAAQFARPETGGRAYLVSDAMAVAGTEADGFDLGGNWITRRDGRLVTAEGRLAGADLTLARAVDVMTTAMAAEGPAAMAEGPAALPRAEVIAMATRNPRMMIGLPGELQVGAPALFQLWPMDAPPRLHLPGGWEGASDAAPPAPEPEPEG